MFQTNRTTELNENDEWNRCAGILRDLSTQKVRIIIYLPKIISINHIFVLLLNINSALPNQWKINFRKINNSLIYWNR